MSIRSINPVDNQLLEEVQPWSAERLDEALEGAAKAAPEWAARPVLRRCERLAALGDVLRRRREEAARTISREMGKRIVEARGEIDKCAWVCDYYAEQAPRMLADIGIDSDAGYSAAVHQPLGTVFGIMPWNFPFWQVLRFGAPAVAAGNTVVLKHAENVPGCAALIEECFHQAGFPEGVFVNLVIDRDSAREVIEDARVHAVTLTGSERAGRAVAAQAGAVMKKTVLELGGSDPFIVLEDADLEDAVEWAATSRFQANGQSCIAAKRFILVERVADEFVERLAERAAERLPGDPLDENTRLGPMARRDLRDELHRQVLDAISHGAKPVVGCELPEGPGAYYPASVLDGITPAMRAWREELFGPVASIIRVADENEALRVANDTPYGLGGSVWTRDSKRGEHLARALQSGSAFVNGMVKSDPRLPFGGIKLSGHGRELGSWGLREFVNLKTLWVR